MRGFQLMSANPSGGVLGHLPCVGGSIEAQKLVMKAVVENPKIAQNLLFAIESGARPEKYGPFIGALIQQDATEQSKQQGAQQ